MTDLAPAILVQALLSAAVFAAALRVARRSRRVAQVVGLVAAAGVLVYAFLLRDATFWATVLPFADLAILSNGFLPCAAALAGSAWAGLPGGWLRRGFSAVAVLAVGAFGLIDPLLGGQTREAQFEFRGRARYAPPVVATATKFSLVEGARRGFKAWRD